MREKFEAPVEAAVFKVEKKVSEEEDGEGEGAGDGDEDEDGEGGVYVYIRFSRWGRRCVGMRMGMGICT